MWFSVVEWSKPRKLDGKIKSDTSRIQSITRNFRPVHENNITNNKIDKEIYEFVKNHDTQIVEGLDQDCTNNNERPTIALLALSYKQNKCSVSFVKCMQKVLESQIVMRLIL